MSTIIDTLGRIPAPATYLLIMTVVLAEAILLIGAFVPTFTTLVTAGALAADGHLHPVLVVTAAALAVAGGDFLGHRAGRTLEQRPRVRHLLAKAPSSAVDRAGTVVQQHGGRAVFAGRFVPVVRTVTPYLAGAARLPYRSIAPFSAAAAALWAAIKVSVGYFALSALDLARTSGPAMTAIAIVGISAGSIALTRRRGNTIRHLSSKRRGEASVVRRSAAGVAR